MWRENQVAVACHPRRVGLWPNSAANSVHKSRSKPNRPFTPHHYPYPAIADGSAGVRISDFADSHTIGKSIATYSYTLMESMKSRLLALFPEHLLEQPDHLIRSQFAGFQHFLMIEMHPCYAGCPVREAGKRYNGYLQ